MSQAKLVLCPIAQWVMLADGDLSETSVCLFFLLIEKSVKLNARLNETPAQTQTHLESDKETKI